jgi:hypothetical protein
MSNPFPESNNVITPPKTIVEPKPCIYIAGPMSGFPDLNHNLFNETADAFEDGGWEVFNPAEIDVETYGSTEETVKAMEADKEGFLRSALAADLQWICEEADAIAMLPGWEKSYGARAEHATAVALGLQIIYLHS